MNTLYRKVLCSESLPNDVNYHGTGNGSCYYYEGRWYDDYGPLSFTPEWWLEEIKIPLDGEIVNWIIVNVLRGLSPEKQKEVTMFLLSRKMIDLPTDEEIESIAKQEYNTDFVNDLIDKKHFKSGFKAALELLMGGK